MHTILQYRLPLTSACSPALILGCIGPLRAKNAPGPPELLTGCQFGVIVVIKLGILLPRGIHYVILGNVKIS